MSTVAKPKKTARKSKSASSKSKKSAKAKKPVPTWIGSAAGKVFVKPGVDLTKPTLKVGKYFV